MITERRELTENDLKLEFMMNAMRLNAGVHPSLFLQRTGMPLNVIETELGVATAKGLIESNIHLLQTTIGGRHYLNDLLQIFMSDTELKHSSEFIRA